MPKILDEYRASILTEVDFRLGTGADLTGGSTMTVTNTSGRFDQSSRGRCFNTGTDSYWTASGSNWDTAKTIGVWAKIPQTLNANNRLISNGANGSVGWTLNIASGGVFVVADGPGGGSFVQETASSFTAKQGVWYFFVATIDALTHTIVPFVDGIKYSSAQVVSTISVNGNSSIGARGDGTFIYPGCIGRAIVIDKTLTDAEITRWYEEEKQSAHYDRVDIKHLKYSVDTDEIITNGDFSGGTTSWVNEGGIADIFEVAGGRLHVGDPTTTFYISQWNVILPSKKYILTFDYDNVLGNPCVVRLYDFGTSSYITIGTTPVLGSGTGTLVFDTYSYPQIHHKLYFSDIGGSTEYYIDNVSLKEVDVTKDVYIADGRGWNESLANETAGFLSNTGLTIKSGTWKVEDNGDGTKKTSNIAGGILSKPCTQAEGTWTFDLFHAAATETRLYFMASSTDAHTVAGQTGYMFSVLGTERLALHRNNGDATSTTLFQTDTGYVAEDAWVSYKVTKSGSTITCYFSTDNGRTWTEIVESSGNNPATDATYTSSNYCVLNLGTADAARNFNFKPYI